MIYKKKKSIKKLKIENFLKIQKNVKYSQYYND